MRNIRTLGYIFATAAFFAPVCCFAQQTYTISVVAGGGDTTPGDGGLATSAQLYEPNGVVEDASGNIYFAEMGRHVIRKVTPNGSISTIAGQYGSGGFSGDGGLATGAQLNAPAGIALDAFGNFYIADATNGRVRKISAGGIITTVAGGGNPPCCGIIGDGGLATEAVVTQPHGVAVDAFGNLYIADVGNARIRKVDANGIITTVAGGGHVAGLGDSGPAVDAQLSNPTGVAVDAVGNLYIADDSHSRIRMVSADGIISTFAGTGVNGSSGDGGPATSAELFVPYGVAVDGFGNVYIADAGNRLVREVSPNGIINTIAGGGSPCCTIIDGQPATLADLGSSLTAITVGAGGALYFSDGRVFKLTPGPLTTSLSGNIVAKAGLSSARVWSIQVSNDGPSAVVAAEISSVVLTQAGGAACTPVRLSALPAPAGNLAPGASVTIPLTFAFSACSANARFTATITLSADAGAASGSIVRLNQFQ